MTYLISIDGILKIQESYTKIIPYLTVQTPFDSSVKGLLLEILRKTDQCLGSKHHENALRVRATTDMLIGSVSQVALNHIGLLVVDEIQNVVGSKHGSIIQKHTMLPYYTRFLNRERRRKAFESLLHMDNAYINFICIPKSKECVIRYLRFCPICTLDDRNQYGETYWHMVRQ